MVINESKLDSVFEIFKVREICQYIGQLALFRTFKNIKEVGHVVWTDMLYMGIYLIFSIALAFILAGKQHLDWRELQNPILLQYFALSWRVEMFWKFLFAKFYNLFSNFIMHEYASDILRTGCSVFIPYVYE